MRFIHEMRFKRNKRSRCCIVSMCFFLFEACSVGPALIPTPLPSKKILDMHCHIAGIGAGNSGCFISQELRDSYKFDIYLKAFGVNQEELEKEGDALIIKRLSKRLRESQYVDAAVILAMDGVINKKGGLNRQETEVYIPNEFVAAACAQYENLYFGASINPYRKDALERLDDMKKKGAVLIKWIPSIQKINPSDIKIIPFYRVLEMEYI